jgi:glyoxylase-like metal-dependent hydrolase (beta-lactamase superfamily II)
MAKAFASQADLAEKKESFVKLSDNAYCLTAEGDPNTGVVVGEDGVMVIDTRATPAMAEDVIRHVRGVTEKPVKYVLLTHYHAVRVMGASGYKAACVIASKGTHELIRERGRQDFDSEVQRFPRLFRNVEGVPGLTWPTLVFDGELTLWPGGPSEVRLKHVGRGHSKGDTIAWMPQQKVLFSGDLVEEGTTPYCGDAYLREWPDTLEMLLQLKAEKLVPGRGDAMMTAEAADKAIAATAAFLRDMRCSVESGVKAGKGLREVFQETYKVLQPKYGGWVIFEHCLPFNVSRCFDEESGIADPRIWTAERDVEMWKTLQG